MKTGGKNAMAEMQIPGKHESRALTDRCTECQTHNEPVVVVDISKDSRQAAYKCGCGRRWFVTWARRFTQLLIEDRAL